MALTPLFRQLEYDHKNGALLHFRVRLEVHGQHDECRLADPDPSKTRLHIEQVAPQWKLLSQSEVVIDRDIESKPGCATPAVRDVWDRWVCRGHVLLEFGAPIPYFNPFSMSGGLTWLTLGKTEVRLILTIYPDGSTREVVEVDGRRIQP